MLLLNDALFNFLNIKLPSGQKENLETAASDDVTMSWCRLGENPPDEGGYPGPGLDDPSENGYQAYVDNRPHVRK